MFATFGLLCFGLALTASLVLTPLAARIATRLGAVDCPDGRRKKQERPVPLGGGVAVVVAAVCSLAVAWLALPRGAVNENTLVSAVPSVVVLLLVGIVDDVVGLTGIYKLIGQVLAASLLVAGGFQFEVISILGWALPLGDMSIPFSMFFCLGAMNAFNLIDGADALAASIGAVVLLTLGIVAGCQGALMAAFASFAMSGALVGFLRYNAPPARVYLGDTGSMVIGWLVAAVAIRSSIKEQAVVALTVPVAICAIPILDAAAALIRRVTTGQSVFTADRGHLHHALLLRGWSPGQTAAAAAGMTAITCSGAILSYVFHHDAFALLAAGGVILVLASAKVFGHAEAALVASHVKASARMFWRRLRPTTGGGDDQADHVIQLQGRRQWNVLWTALREAAPVYGLRGLKLNVNMPHLHESFFASWKASNADDSTPVWRLSVPLRCGDRPIGRLLVEGRAQGTMGLLEMQQLLDFLEPLEAEIQRIVDDVEAVRAEGAESSPQAESRLKTNAASARSIASRVASL